MWLPALLFATHFFNCNAQKNSTKYTVAFYNIENLFDTINDPKIDDEEFLPEGKYQWNTSRYVQKLNSLSKVIDSLGDPDGPEILGLCEVENRDVVQDLTNTPKLKNKGYGIVHINSPDGRGIDVALIFKKEFFTPEAYTALPVRLDLDPDFKTRDILLVSGKSKYGDKLHLFVNHWPSRRGGKEATDVKRIQAAKVARKAVDSLFSIDPKAKILLMGDFNDEPTDESIMVHLNAQQKSTTPQTLQNLMWALKAEGKGTHMHAKQWNMLDQIIVSKAFTDARIGLNIIAGSAGIYAPEWMKDPNPKFGGSPYRTYAGEKYLGGYSDHFPVFVHLVKAGK
jgi:predicted extracellular nuclease